VAVNVKQGKTYLEIVDKTKTKVLVGYTLHFFALMRDIKHLLEQGVIGTPVSFQVLLGCYDTLQVAKNRFSSSNRNELFIDYSHEWDYVDWFLGPFRKVAAISHQSGNLELTQNPNVVDCLTQLQNGITGTVHLDYVKTHRQRRFTIVGDKGTIESDVLAGVVKVEVKGETFARQYQYGECVDTAFECEHDHFLQIVRGKEEPLVTVEDGLRAVAVADALILSCETREWQIVQYS